MPRFNPFRPNNIVHTGMFAGRNDEITAIEKSLWQTKNGNPKNFLITGERGIGKTSLLYYIGVVAEGKIPFLDGQVLRFAVVSIEMDGTFTFGDLVKRVGQELKIVISQHDVWKSKAKKVWDFLSSWKVLGVEYKKSEMQDHSAAVSELSQVFADFVKAAGPDLDGIILLIDEADKPNSEAGLGEFCKIFTERMAKIGCNQVCIGLAGLPSVHQKLRESHESSLRVFEDLILEPLKGPDIRRAIARALDEAKEKNSEDITISDDAVATIVSLSEGYPHFIQQFGYAAFDANIDDEITVDDVTRGAFSKNGALDQLGHKYFHEMYFDRIGSPDYRLVLQAMATGLDGWISRRQIIAESGVSETQVNNALSALRKNGIIIKSDEKQGVYKLPTKSFAVWIRARELHSASADEV